MLEAVCNGAQVSLWAIWSIFACQCRITASEGIVELPLACSFKLSQSHGTENEISTVSVPLASLLPQTRRQTLHIQRLCFPPSDPRSSELLTFGQLAALLPWLFLA